MSLGIYEANLDSKNRLPIPAKLRERLKGSIVIFFHQNLRVSSEQDYRALRETNDEVFPIFTAELDTQNRLLIPSVVYHLFPDFFDASYRKVFFLSDVDSILLFKEFMEMRDYIGLDHPLQLPLFNHRAFT